MVWVGLCVFAVLVGLFDTVGVQVQHSISALLEVNPNAAADRLAEGPLVSLPALVVRSRLLDMGALRGVPSDSIRRAVGRFGKLQRRWLPADAAGFLNLARERLAEGRFEESAEALNAALVRNPTSARLHRFKALYLFAVGGREEALEEVAFGEAIDPGLEGFAASLTGDDLQRIRLRSLRLRSTIYPRQRITNSLALARELRISGDEQSALALIAELRGHPDIEIELASWALDTSDYDGASDLALPIATRRTLPAAVRARAWSIVAIARDLNGDAAGALEAAQTALELEPRSPTPYVTLSALAQGRGDLDGALEYLRKAWGLQPANTSLLVRIAAVAEQAGKPSDALLALARAVEIEPESPRLATRLVELQLRTGNYPEAAMTLSRALDRHPTDASLLRLADRLPREIGVR